MRTLTTALTRPASWDGGLYLRDDAVRDVHVDGAAPYYGRTASGYGSKIPTRYRLALAGALYGDGYALRHNTITGV